MSDSLSDFVTTRDAALRLGVGIDHINHLIDRGKIIGKRMGKYWLVYVPSLEHYRNTKDQRGRRPLKQKEQQEKK
ncbi:MAG: hypothetical protein B6D41_12215 [Chloroflexi bacterium UTCFX4]|jgi:excisionase family DNA binding protein|nr:MAG: hypothetical protein B6D41_12215 [Chloroflexi bacterium UTCFX4]